MEYRQHIESTSELANWYDSKYVEMGDGWHTPAEEINQHLDDLGVPFNHDLWLLDIGCGAGHFLAEAQKRVDCYGIDISKAGLQHASRRADKSMLEVCSIENWFDGEAGKIGPFDYAVSMGSLEHVIDLNKALDVIHRLLKPAGRFYFYCPNEKWKHFDQPNERTMSDDEWIRLFAAHGLYVHTKKRWNDSTAFVGTGTAPNSVIELPPHGNKLNIGSGQRRFDTAHGWINVDVVSRPPDQIPDLICDVGKDKLPYPDASMQLVVLHQVYEHFGLGEGHGVIREAHRVLQPGGSLILTVPDMRKLAQRWLLGQIDDYIYFVNVYGAFQGLDGDRHKWGFCRTSLVHDLQKVCTWSKVVPFDGRDLIGSNISMDWWILALECVK